MTVLGIQRKLAAVLPKGARSFGMFVKDAILLYLQETSKKIAVFEGKYNKSFPEFKKEWAKRKNAARHSYEIEGDYLDWEALEAYKRDLMRVLHSL